MRTKMLTLKESMLRQVKANIPHTEDREKFERDLSEYLQNLQSKNLETEESQKNLLRDFLKKVLPNNFINPIRRIDLAICHENSVDSSIGVLIECKSLLNKSEMMTIDNLNTKSFQEVVSYYLNERDEQKNIEIKKCIVTNGFSWFIIDSKEIEKYFYNNKKLIHLYQKWKSKQLSGSTTEFLYSNVISPQIDIAIKKGIKITQFDLQDAVDPTNNEHVRKRKIIQLYQFFTAQNLLNKEYFFDFTKLNQAFYGELLYLMGVEEKRENNTKMLKRLPESSRQSGSLVENIINRLTLNDVPEEVHYDIAIQLSVIWINRILFLKLLESQLVVLNKNEEFLFLNEKMLPKFEDLYDLFFGVLGKKIECRSIEMQVKFINIPYLNSSLFEETELERDINGLSIDRLHEKNIDIYPKTVLKRSHNKRETGNINFLSYLYKFLNAYDFSTVVHHHSKIRNELINASVLGLIFEKINGYKEGAYFTPGRITMYMSRDSVRKIIIDRVNEAKGWDVKDINELTLFIRNLDTGRQINEIINSIKICDPAVGSGHFLVAVLNEIIVVKSELGILFDSEGKSLNIHCTVENDELIIRDFNGDNIMDNTSSKSFQRIQSTIFYEKDSIIKHCLYGVDINKNSINICRLRLWIELLKSSYYYEDDSDGKKQFITLPNIDLNIKEGNSLLNNLSSNVEIIRSTSNYLNIEEYTKLVSKYKDSNDKKEKKELIKEINEIKEKIYMSFNTYEVSEVQRLMEELQEAERLSLFLRKSELVEHKERCIDLEIKLREALNRLEKVRLDPLFKNAFEWRIEFPEILDTEGNYIGFDLIIGNPPYIYSTNEVFTSSQKEYFKQKYKLNKYQANTYGLFLELGLKLLKRNGYISFIIPNSFLSNKQFRDLRKYIFEETGEVVITNSVDKIFEDASVDNCIISFKIAQPTDIELGELRNDTKKVINRISPSDALKSNTVNVITPISKEINDLIVKIEEKSKELEPNYAKIRDGIKVYQCGKGTPKQPENKVEFEEFKKDSKWLSDTKKGDDCWEFLRGENISRYKIKESGEFLKYGKFLAEPRQPEMFRGKRLLIRQIPSKSVYSLNAMYTEASLLHERSLIAIQTLEVDPFYLLGVINSKVLSYYVIHKYSILNRTTFPQLRLTDLRTLPIPNVDSDKQKELATLVKRQINLHKILKPTQNDEEEMKNIDNSIDNYIMNLLLLTDEEKSLIKGFSI